MSDILSTLIQLWNDLEASIQPDCNSETMVTKGVSSQGGNKLFVGIYPASGTRFLLLQSRKDIAEKQTYGKRDWFEVKNCDGDGREKMNIVLELNESIDRNIVFAFVGLSAWVAAYVLEVPADKERLQAEAFKRGIRHWLKIHDQKIDKPLTEPQQRGLYAELWFLRKYAAEHLNWKDAIKYWVGPGGKDQDFYFPACSVEVKAVADDDDDENDRDSGAGQHIKISNEFQLDPIPRPKENGDDVRSSSVTLHLFLYCLFLREENLDSAETLYEIVEDVRHKLSEINSGRHEFEAKLLRTGYRKKHEDTYQQVRRSVVRELFCRVADTDAARFPRITRSGVIGASPQIPASVEKVRYRVPVKDIEEFEVRDADVIEHFSAEPNV